MSKSVLISVFAGAALAAAIGASTALAAGGGGGGGGGAGTQAPVTCNAGYVYDQAKGVCVRASSWLIDDHDLIAQGRALALWGHYEKALETLGYVKNQKDPMVLTYVGYSNRKLGRVDEGIAYYKQALAIDPYSLNTREYLGEGYVQAGRKDLALAELSNLEKLCGSDCDQYERLEMVIAGVPGAWQQTPGVID
jgi:tetratricopeptide (TPR) repeat protein